MKVIKTESKRIELERIESLCELHPCSWSYADQLVPVGKYKLFYNDGNAYVQDYLLKKDRNKVSSLKKVTEFSLSEKEQTIKYQPKNNERRD